MCEIIPITGRRFVDYDFLHKLPQQGRGEFLKAGVNVAAVVIIQGAVTV